MADFIISDQAGCRTAGGSKIKESDRNTIV